MKPVIAKLISVTPIIVVIAIVTYTIEEVVEDFYSETISDFVYPIGAIVILAVLWYKVMPSIQTYLNEDATNHPKDIV